LNLSSAEDPFGQARLPNHRGQNAWLDIVFLAVARDHHEPRSPADVPFVDTVASALPIQLEAVPHQDPNEIAKLHML
jgi:hypothetical protein